MDPALDASPPSAPAIAAPATATARHALPNRQPERQPERADIAQLVDAFYGRVRDDALIGPVFAKMLEGRWDSHMPKMVDFWSSLVLREKSYQGNLKAAHQPLAGLTPEHFNRWLALFFDTVEQRYEPDAAIQFIEPALRIAHSLQLSRFGWEFKVPEAQQALLEKLRPRRKDESIGSA